MARIKYTAVPCIYIIVNTKNGKVYIGQAQDIRKRWRGHKASLNGKYHPNPHLQAAWDKYGAKSFKFQILEYCSIEQLDEREQHYLDVYMAKGICYNLSLDAVSPMRGRKFSEESRRKLHAKVLSSETRQKISKALAGRVRSEDHCRKISEAQKGKTRSEETRQKLSEAKKNPSAETRQRMSDSHKGQIPSNKGKQHTDESRKKMSEAHKGVKLSQEHRKSMSEAQIRRHERDKQDTD